MNIGKNIVIVLNCVFYENVFFLSRKKNTAEFHGDQYNM